MTLRSAQLICPAHLANLCCILTTKSDKKGDSANLKVVTQGLCGVGIANWQLRTISLETQGERVSGPGRCRRPADRVHNFAEPGAGLTNIVRSDNGIQHR